MDKKRFLVKLTTENLQALNYAVNLAVDYERAISVDFENHTVATRAAAKRSIVRLQRAQRVITPSQNWRDGTMGMAAALGRLGGSVSSDAKAAAARANGAKGGRPRLSRRDGGPFTIGDQDVTPRRKTGAK